MQPQMGERPGAGAEALPALCRCSQPRSSLNPSSRVYLGTYLAGLLTQSLDPLPSPLCGGCGGCGLNSEFLAPPPGLVLLATGAHPKASGGLTRSLLIRTKGAPMILGTSQGA